MSDIPDKQVPSSLSQEDKKKQIKSIIKGIKRPKVKYPKRRSKWTIAIHDYFGKTPSLEDISRETKVPITGLKEIIQKGEGAYFTSGSRPNVSPEQWGIARLYAVLMGSKGARRVDADIINKYKIPILKGKIKGGSALVEDIIQQKDFPENQSNEVNEIIQLITFQGKPSILGSQGVRSQKYTSDYDLFETVRATSVKRLVKQFQTIVKRILMKNDIYILDIKCGLQEPYKIIDETAQVIDDRVFGQNADESRNKVQSLFKSGALDKSQRDSAMKLLVDNPTVEQLREIIKKLRLHILRWTPKDILKGQLEIDGKKYTLEKAMSDPTLFKLDTIALLSNNHFTEFNVIQDLRIGRKRLNNFRVDTPFSLLRDIQQYHQIGEQQTMIKRMFSLLKQRLKQVKLNKDKNGKLIQILNDIMNSDLGIIYNIKTDIDTLIDLINNQEDVPLDKIKSFIDSFINRLSNVYTISDYLKKEPAILNTIQNILQSKSTTNIGASLDKIKSQLSSTLNSTALNLLRRQKLLPLPQDFVLN